MAATRSASRASGRIPSLFCLTGNLSEIKLMPPNATEQTYRRKVTLGWREPSYDFPVCSGISVTIQILLVHDPDSLSEFVRVSGLPDPIPVCRVLVIDPAD